MFVNRDWKRTEGDDFALNVQPLLRDGKEAIPQYADQPKIGSSTLPPVVVGWKIVNQYE